MRKGIYGILITLLLAGGAVLCFVRWQAWFGMPAEQEWTGDTLSYTFPCFERDTTPESLTLLVLGDIHNGLSREQYDTLAARVPQAEAVVQTGDWLERGYFYYKQQLLHEWMPSRLCGTPVIACPGNHEYMKGLHKQLSPVWDSTFVHPHNGPKQVPGEHYYLDFPQLRLIAIDTNPLTRIVHLTRTLTWLGEAMNTAGDRFVVVIMHHPVFSVAKGRFNSLVYGTFRYALGKADLVLAGHDHSYMRRTPFVVINTAGRPKEQVIRYSTDTTATEPVYGVLQTAIDQSQASTLRFNVYRLNDAVLIDSLYVKHD